LALYTRICKLIRQVSPPAVAHSSKLGSVLFWLVTLLPWPSTFRPLNGVMDYPSRGLPSCQFFLAC